MTAAAAPYPLTDTVLTLGGRSWTLTAVRDQDALMGSVQTDADLEHFPYGLLLWDAAIGLAEELTARPERVAGKRVLELGAGVGLPGLVARSLGAQVTQTDYQAAALALARRNARQNNIAGIRYLQADWRDFYDGATYEVVLGSDVLYERSLHSSLLRLFRRALASDGQLLLSDPVRPQAMEFAANLERSGWQIGLGSRRIRRDEGEREIALFFARKNNL